MNGDGENLQLQQGIPNGTVVSMFDWKASDYEIAGIPGSPRLTAVAKVSPSYIKSVEYTSWYIASSFR